MKNSGRDFCWLALFLITAASAQGFGPAATVGNVEISRAKVEAQVEHLINERGLGSGGITQPYTYRQIQEEVVEQLIVQELLWQEAKRRNIVVSYEEVDVELKKLKDNFDTELAFEFKIKEGGFTEESFRENIRQQRSVQRMIADDVIPSIEIDEKAIDAFYQENISEMAIPERIRARHILVRLEADADDAARAEALDKIESIRQKLDAGESFALIAVEHSEGPSASRGGDLGYFGRGQMVAAFEEAAFALEPGTVSDVVETEFGLHLIKVEERIDAGTASLSEVAPQIESYLAQQALEHTVEDLIESLRSEENVEIHLW